VPNFGQYPRKNGVQNFFNYFGTKKIATQQNYYVSLHEYFCYYSMLVGIITFGILKICDFLDPNAQISNDESWREYLFPKLYVGIIIISIPSFAVYLMQVAKKSEFLLGVATVLGIGVALFENYFLDKFCESFRLFFFENSTNFRTKFYENSTYFLHFF